MKNALRTPSIFLASALLISLATSCRSNKVASGEPLERIQAWYENPAFHVGNGKDLIEWTNQKAPELTVYNPVDQWSNGFAKSMTPLLVDWEPSQWDFSSKTISSNNYMRVHNVYVAGNPIIGETTLSTVHVPMGSIKTVELVVVRYHLKGLAKTSGHVQLRFVFDENNRPYRLKTNGDMATNDPYIDDLIMSWEAWRPTQASWDFKEGLDPEAYLLTARMYAGKQRFLQDSLRGAVWDCYPIDLSAHTDTADTIFLSGLLMGDAVGRKLISGILEKAKFEENSEKTRKKWSAYKENNAIKKFMWKEIPESPAQLATKDLDPHYHALMRSCINLSLQQVDFAMEHLYKKHDLGERTPVRTVPQSVPKWFDSLIEGKSGSMALRTPHAIFWIMNNKDVLPYKGYRPLEKANLLQRDKKGKLIFYRYGHKDASPYGPLKENIM